jgi:glycosyltransferase involved in cell wall biosynthesis
VLPDARFLLVGQGSRTEKLRVRARASPAGDRVSFVGVKPREALPDYYRAADLFCFASQTETQGLVLAEAHACGLPAVAVRAAGVEEVVRDGETGLLVKAEPGALAEAMLALLLDPATRQTMSERAVQVASREFDADRQAERVAALYARVREGGRR